MAGWISGSESDEEPLNLNLFNRKCFGFLGFPDESVNTFKNIVKQLGGSCDSHAKYVFTSRSHYNSLTEKNSNLYNISFIRDCVDANRYLNIEQYRFSFKDEKRDFRDFDPCCNNFHKDEQGCFICDPAYKKDLSIKQRRKIKQQTNQTTEVKEDVSVKDKMTDTKSLKRKNSWEPWEVQILLDYIICNNLYVWVKSTSMYKRVVNDGFLTHRTPESMRTHFCKQILPVLDNYDLPKPVKRKFSQVRKAMYPGRLANKMLNIKNAKNKVIVKRQMSTNQMKRKNMNNKKA